MILSYLLKDSDYTYLFSSPLCEGVGAGVLRELKDLLDETNQSI